MPKEKTKKESTRFMPLRKIDLEKRKRKVTKGEKWQKICYYLNNAAIEKFKHYICGSFVDKPQNYDDVYTTQLDIDEWEDHGDLDVDECNITRQNYEDFIEDNNFFTSPSPFVLNGSRGISKEFKQILDLEYGDRGRVMENPLITILYNQEGMLGDKSSINKICKNKIKPTSIFFQFYRF